MISSVSKKTICAVVTGVIIVSSSVFAGLASSGQYEQVMNMKFQGKTMSGIQLVKWSGNKVRVEGTNGPRKSTMIDDGKKLYYYDPVSKSAMTGGRPSRSSKPMNLLETMVAGAKQIIKGGKKIGTQKVGGFTCDVYQMEHPQSKQKVSTKAWINKGSNFPVVIKLESRVGKDTNTLVIRNVHLGVKYPASVFALPKGAKLIEHPSMGTQNPHGTMNPHGSMNPHKGVTPGKK